MVNFRRIYKKGSLILEASVLLPIVLASILLIASMIRLDRTQSVTFHELANTVLTEQNASAVLSNPVAIEPLASNGGECPLIIPFFSRVMAFRESVRYHTFTGEKGTASLKPEILESEGGLVWVFPKRGECYHTGDCRIVHSTARRVLLSREIRKKYSPCENCSAKDLNEGTPVYVFDYGESYHRGTCSAVTKYMKSVPIEVAIEGGYRSCQYCW